MTKYDRSAARVRQLRQGLALSAEAMARNLGVTRATVERWERGKCVPSPLAKQQLDELEQRQKANQGPD